MVSVSEMDNVWVMVCVWVMPIASVQVSVRETDRFTVLVSAIVSVMDSVRAVEIRIVVRIRQRKSESLSILIFINSVKGNRPAKLDRPESGTIRKHLGHIPHS